jgi:glycerol-3-phosphate acyltransferase PlsY
MLPILFIFAYLIGSISTAIIVCKIFNLPDPRSQYSNNPGATNVLRIGGKKPAVITLIGDGLKGFIPVLIAKYLDVDLGYVALIGMAVFFGHLYPIFFRFKGGKGVATFLGIIFALNYLGGIIFALVWIFNAKILKMSSFSSLVATLIMPVYFYLINDYQSIYAITIMAIFIFYRHKENIKNILAKNESKVK